MNINSTPYVKQTQLVKLFGRFLLKAQGKSETRDEVPKQETL
jgi:hypothetical protein